MKLISEAAPIGSSIRQTFFFPFTFDGEIRQTYSRQTFPLYGTVFS